MLHRKSFNYLILLSVLVILPHTVQVSPLVSAYTFFCIFWRFCYEWRGFALPGKVVGFFISLSGIALALALHGKPLGIVPATAMLEVALSALLLRKSEKKDPILIFATCSILLICSAVQEQTIFMSLHLIATFMTMILYLQQASAQTEDSLQLDWKSVFKTILLVGPIVMFLFFIVPRTTRSFIPPLLKNTATSGFSDQLDPGSVSRLIQSDELAFRVRFINDEETPLRRDMYWRGKTLSTNLGMKWAPGLPNKDYASQLQYRAPTVETEVILEPNYRSWLFVLDKPATLAFQQVIWQGYLQQGHDFTFNLSKNATERLMYRATSALVTNDKLKGDRLKEYLAMPEDADAKVKELINRLKQKSRGATQFAQNLGEYLTKEKHVYSLQPGVLNQNTIAEFLFEKKKGFCEHYAALSAYLFRAAHIPSRVVLGFHGGEFNELDGYYSLTGKDAHAWVEYFHSDTQNWRRFDATAYLARDRLENGGQNFHLAAGGLVSSSFAQLPESLRSVFSRFGLFLSAVSNRFNMFMLSYDFSSQRNILESLNIEISKKGLIAFTFLFLSLLIVLLLLFFKWRSRSTDPVLSLYTKFVKNLAYSGFFADETMAPSTVLEALKKRGFGNDKIEFLENFISYRYAGPHRDLTFSVLKKSYQRSKGRRKKSA